MTFGGQATSPDESRHILNTAISVLRRFFCTVALETRSRVQSPNVMKVRRQQRRVVSSDLCRGDALVSGPVALPA